MTFANVIVWDTKLNGFQPKSDPVSILARTTQASREVQFDAQQREDAHVRALRSYKARTKIG